VKHFSLLGAKKALKDLAKSLSSESFKKFIFVAITKLIATRKDKDNLIGINFAQVQ
jgi:hypothetical protein